MRENVQQSSHHKYQLRDFYLARYLIARNWNIEAAAKMYIDSMQWRKENNIDEIYKTFTIQYAKELSQFMKYWPGIITHTKDGWPLYIERSGLLDPYSVLKNTTADFRFNLNIWRIENMEKSRRKMEKKTGTSAGTIIVVDMTGLSWAHATPSAMEVLKENSHTNKNNYPETLRRSIIIDVPSIFGVIWNMVTPFLDPSTLDKTTILGSNFIDTLLEVSPPENIPSNLGGTAPPLPPGGIYRPNEAVNEHAIVQEIPAGSYFEKEIYFVEPSKLEWEWKTDNMDIGFSIWRPEGYARKEIVKWTRMFSNSGAIDTEGHTKYFVLFDNNYSWTNKKVIHYHFTITPNDPNKL